METPMTNPPPEPYRPPDLGQQVHERVAPVMLAITEGMQPLHDSADDVREQMRRRGYSEQAAEGAAMVFLQHGMAHLWGAMAAARHG
jgi:hypothetical protein